MSDPAKASSFADLSTRIASALVLAAVAGAALWLGDLAFAALLSVASGLMVWEYRRMVIGEAGISGLPFWVMTGIAALVPFYAWVFGGWMLPVVATVSAIAVAMLDRGKALWTVPFLFYLCFAVLVAMGLRTGGIVPVLLVVLLVIAADVGGYFFGRIFGGPKLWPRVSPKKTWSGTVGGWVLAVLVAVAFRLAEPALTERPEGFLTDWGDWYLTIYLAFFVAAASQAGDLAESAVKRHFGVKDSSNLIPGHGGLLDRFDGQLGGFAIVGLLSLNLGV